MIQLKVFASVPRHPERVFMREGSPVFRRSLLRRHDVLLGMIQGVTVYEELQIIGGVS